MNGFQMNGRTVDPQKQSVIVELLLLKKTQARLQQKCVRTHFSFVHPVKKSTKINVFAIYKHFHYANHNYCRISSFEENPDQIATKIKKIYFLKFPVKKNKTIMLLPFIIII